MIGWRDGDGGLHEGSLFATFAALARGEAWSFPALRPHQREPWHAFTVQVAALGLIRAGIDTPPKDEGAWRDLLLALSDGCEEAWELVVADWSKPALLQPPVPAAHRADYKSKKDDVIYTPDALDMLVTAKAHDLKPERMAAASDEDWLFALVTLQTASAYGGARTYGASRMNGKTGSRLISRLKPEGGAGAGFRRDVVLLASAAQCEADQKALLWLEPNAGLVPLPLHTLAPSLYVDCARRIRLQRTSEVTAYYATAEKARVNADASAGITGDPYAPIKKERDASITPKRETFGYKGITRLLAADVPLLGQLHESDVQKGLRLSFSALVRRGGTDTNTEGFFERTVRTSQVKEIEELRPALVLDQIGDMAKRRSDEAGAAGRRLRRALILLVQGGPDQARLDDDAAGKKVELWVRRFDSIVDRIFFDEDFWSEAAGKTPGPRTKWRERLRDLARPVFDEAAEAAPRTAMRRIRAVARARSMLDVQMSKWLKEIADGE